MKRIISILIVLAVFLCLVSCNTPTTPIVTDNTPEYGQAKDYNIYLWTDEETGVQYIVYNRKDGYGGMGGITPRLNADGTLYIGEQRYDKKD